MGRKPLTRLENNIYRFICDFLTENGYPPTEAEICKGCYISNSVAHRYVDRLQEKGYVCKQERKARTLKII